MACRIGKNESYRSYSSNFDEPAYHFGVQVLGAPPMYGYNRVLGQLSRRNGDQRKYKINLESKLIETLKASENKHRFRRFHRRWKAIREGDRTSSVYDLEYFTYVHTQDHMRGKYRAQKGPSWPSKRACRIGKNECYRNYSSNFEERAYHFGVQVLGAPPMYGYNRVLDRKSTRLNSSHPLSSRMPSSA